MAIHEIDNYINILSWAEEQLLALAFVYLECYTNLHSVWTRKERNNLKKKIEEKINHEKKSRLLSCMD